MMINIFDILDFVVLGFFMLHSMLDLSNNEWIKETCINKITESTYGIKK